MVQEPQAHAFDDVLQSGLLDMTTFSSDGTVIGVFGRNTLQLSLSDNLFEVCPIFSGMVDVIGELVDEYDNQFTLPSVNLPDSQNETVQLCDLRVCRSRNSDEFVLVTTSVSNDEMPHLEAVREARHKAYETELYELERKRFEEYYAHSPILSFALDAEMNVIASSRQLQEFATGTSGDPAQWVSYFLQSNENQISKEASLVTAVRHDGSIRSIEVAHHSVANSVTGKLEIYYVLLDVTDREALLRSTKRSQIELSELSSKLQVSNQRLEDFARMAAHDLVAPLGRLSVFSEILEQEVGDVIPEQASFAIEAIQSSSKRCREVVTDILELAQVEGVEPDYQEVLIEPLIHQVISDLIGNPKDISLIFDCDFQSMFVDQKLARLIFRNILSNAVKYRSADRPLEIRITGRISNNNFARVEIADNGRGFLMKDGVSPFDPFVRMQNASGKAGSGLGLNMVENACHHLGWTPSISSKPDQGTVVSLRDIIPVGGEE
jgi:signal transduction histidine kinase